MGRYGRRGADEVRRQGLLAAQGAEPLLELQGEGGVRRPARHHGVEPALLVERVGQLAALLADGGEAAEQPGPLAVGLGALGVGGAVLEVAEAVLLAADRVGTASRRLQLGLDLAQARRRLAERRAAAALGAPPGPRRAQPRPRL